MTASNTPSCIWRIRRRQSPCKIVQPSPPVCSGISNLAFGSKMMLVSGVLVNGILPFSAFRVVAVLAAAAGGKSTVVYNGSASLVNTDNVPGGILYRLARQNKPAVKHHNAARQIPHNHALAGHHRCNMCGGVFADAGITADERIVADA